MAKVPQRVQAGVFRLAGRGDHAGGDLRRHPDLPNDALVPDDVAAAGREDEPEPARRTSELPFAQRVHHERPDRDRALAGFGLRHADSVVAIGALTHVQVAALHDPRAPRAALVWTSITAQPAEGHKRPRPILLRI
jgi:hypothetical protein